MTGKIFFIFFLIITVNILFYSQQTISNSVSGGIVYISPKKIAIQYYDLKKDEPEILTFEFSKDEVLEKINKISDLKVNDVVKIEFNHLNNKQNIISKISMVKKFVYYDEKTDECSISKAARLNYDNLD